MMGVTKVGPNDTTAEAGCATVNAANCADWKAHCSGKAVAIGPHVLEGATNKLSCVCWSCAESSATETLVCTDLAPADRSLAVKRKDSGVVDRSAPESEADGVVGNVVTSTTTGGVVALECCAVICAISVERGVADVADALIRCTIRAWFHRFGLRRAYPH